MKNARHPEEMTSAACPARSILPQALADAREAVAHMWSAANLVPPELLGRELARELPDVVLRAVQDERERLAARHDAAVSTVTAGPLTGGLYFIARDQSRGHQFTGPLFWPGAALAAPTILVAVPAGLSQDDAARLTREAAERIAGSRHWAAMTADASADWTDDDSGPVPAPFGLDEEIPF